MKTIALLCNQNPNEATFRINFLGLLKASKDLGFHCDYLNNFTSYPDIILTQRQYSLTPETYNYLVDCKNNGTKIVTIINDVYKVDVPVMLEWTKISDLILTPTILHKQIIQSITDTRVEVMMDCIDYSIDTKFPSISNNSIPRICWFGYAESYMKSMNIYHDIIEDLVSKGKMEFDLITSIKEDTKPPKENFGLVKFNASTFIEDIRKYDGCILSHTPLDWEINTFVKSPNKLILSIALGVPAIVSNTPSYSQILSHTNLSHFTFSGTESFIKSLNNLLDPKQRENYLTQSQDYVVSNFNYKKMAQQLLNYIS